jgi:exosortase E/protease (VPEID-CTERM system)
VLAGAAALVAVGEVLVLSLAFDAQPLVARGGPWVVLGGGGQAITFLVTVATTLLLLELVRPPGGVSLTEPFGRYRAPLWFWIGHAVAFAALLWVTHALFPSGSGGVSHGNVPAPGGWGALAAWGTLVVATAMTLARCALPFRAWAELLSRARKTLLIALVAGAVAWASGRAGDESWIGLSGVTLDVSARLLHIVEGEIVLHPEQALIGTPRFAVSVAPVCSGLAGMGLMAVFGGVFMFAGRAELRLRRVALLLPLAMLFVWFANTLRIALLIMLGSRGWPGIAMSGFHSKAGWFFFCFVALALLFVVRRTPFFLREAAETTKDTYNPTLVYFTPLAVQLGVAMLAGMFVVHVDRAYGLRVVAVAVALWLLRRWLPRWRLRLHWDALGLGVLGFVAWTALAGPHDAQELGAAQRELGTFGSVWFGCWIALRVLGSVVTVPIAEELAFRGCLLPRVIDADFLEVPPRKLTVAALVVSSVAFGVLHDNWLGATACGVLFALARQRRGQLSDAIVAHATVNLLIAADVLLRGEWQLWL